MLRRLRWTGALLAAALVCSSALYAVGNDVITDPAEALQAGFEAVDVRKSPGGESRGSSDSKVISFRIRVSLAYDFGEMGTRKFASVGLIRPDPGTAPGPMLLATDSRIPVLFDIDGDSAVTHQIRMRSSELVGTYFEFGYAFEQGMVPLLVHIPSCALLEVCEAPAGDNP